jgi:hypothetical protein
LIGSLIDLESYNFDYIKDTAELPPRGELILAGFSANKNNEKVK